MSRGGGCEKATVVLLGSGVPSGCWRRPLKPSLGNDRSPPAMFRVRVGVENIGKGYNAERKKEKKVA